MNPTLQIVDNTTTKTGPAVWLMDVGAKKAAAENAEAVLEEMAVRATYVGSVLEAILHEPHGEPRWGLNE